MRFFGFCFWDLKNTHLLYNVGSNSKSKSFQMVKLCLHSTRAVWRLDQQGRPCGSKDRPVPKCLCPWSPSPLLLFPVQGTWPQSVTPTGDRAFSGVEERMGARSPELVPPSNAFPGHKMGAELEVEQWRHKPAPIWNIAPHHHRQRVNMLHHHTSPFVWIFISI